MKKLFKTFVILALGSFVLASCNDKTDIDLGQYEEEERKFVAALAAEKVKIENYLANLTEEDALYEAEEDTVLVPLQFINDEVTRGMWYKVITPPTDDSYEYKISGSGYLTYPKVKLNYTAKLLDGTLVESAEGENYDFGSQSAVINYAWLYSFFPYSIRINSEDRVISGLTEDGLKVGSKFVVVVPSYLAYGSVVKTGGVEDIPANSPLVYEFEVLQIGD
ncbi:FKBP-type peptidyl-prolyl cis-trans isomerase [Parapedobacter sp. SGR-10]|uniref:FKBP-type peptidyl-prolyl cis-trans isomerase n=1 Tax=Parapedobacter sp. SGR-10 TaxID=2710879 RepID=UPI0013D57475|nr:FKBP-type peptidyl-prolyl cis-trans isomerase [Parapedobacter sp. SGR-10]NGF57691.1 FKBP-type peptidyl-prolyl cis-trans isomerase [Parapedobacter sp. SGR-10]